MRVLDPGHDYLLDALDGDAPVRLTFVKREGPGYPGNVGHHPGTNLQEVLRACLDRVRYLDGQVPCTEDGDIVALLREALWLLEVRAGKRHGRPWPSRIAGIETLPTCRWCGHVLCVGNCRARDARDPLALDLPLVGQGTLDAHATPGDLPPFRFSEEEP